MHVNPSNLLSNATLSWLFYGCLNNFLLKTLSIKLQQNIEFYKLKYEIFYFAKRQLISEKYKYLMVDLLTTKLLPNRIM